MTTGAGEVRGAWVKLLFGFKLMQAGDGLGRFSDTGHMICVACMEAGSKVGLGEWPDRLRSGHTNY